MTITGASEGLSYVNFDISLEREKDGDVRLSLKLKRYEYRSYEVLVSSYSPVSNTKKLHDRLAEWIRQILEDQRDYIEKRKSYIDDLIENFLNPVKVARRILDFAFAISGGDSSKIPILREAVERAFEEVREIFGRLPEVSEKTRDLVMRGFKEWEKGGDFLEYLGKEEYFEEEVEIELVA